MADRNVLITGASTGIGASCARQLAKDGVRVFAGVRSRVDGERIEADAPGRIRSVRLDVTQETSIEEARRQIEEDLGGAGLTGLVNNAGIAVAGPVEFLTPEQLRTQFEVNVFGLVRVTQVFLDLLRKGGGRIVNMGSIAGRSATPLLGAYAASKHAVEALTDSLRQELSPWGIPVSVIEPGAIATPIWEKGRRNADSERDQWPELMLERYGQALEAILRAVDEAEERALPPEAVARRVEHALFARRPRTRYLVGTEARLQAWMVRWLPDRWRDSIVLWHLGI